MKWIEQESAEYKRAFELALTAGVGGPSLEQRLRRLASELPQHRTAIDWGAGGGRGTALLSDLFERVYAVEPNPRMRRSIAEVAPGAVLLQGDLATARVPEPINFGLINHVYYHVPDAEWGPQTLRCAAHLTDRGLLCVSLKHPNAGCGDMLEHFGAPRFDLYSLARVFREQCDFTIEFVNTPGRIETTSLEDTLTIARFVLSDRPAEGFSRLCDEREFEAYVRSHFWNESEQRGGWANPKVYALVRRNRLLAGQRNSTLS